MCLQGVYGILFFWDQNVVGYRFFLV
jgi:hypothetical protein